MVLRVRKARPTTIQQHHGNGRRRGLFHRRPHWSVTSLAHSQHVCGDSHPPLDEVESLTAARAGAMAGTEPSDGLRVSGLPGPRFRIPTRI
jgi:hypothetical protein